MSETLGQRYLLGDKLGEGGTAAAFRALCQELGVVGLEVPRPTG